MLCCSVVEASAARWTHLPRLAFGTADAEAWLSRGPHKHCAHPVWGRLPRFPRGRVHTSSRSVISEGINDDDPHYKLGSSAYMSLLPSRSVDRGGPRAASRLRLHRRGGLRRFPQVHDVVTSDEHLTCDGRDVYEIRGRRKGGRRPRAELARHLAVDVLLRVAELRAARVGRARRRARAGDGSAPARSCRSRRRGACPRTPCPT